MILPSVDTDSIELDQQDYLKLYSTMLTTAYGFMRNKPDALDVVQESWVKILEKNDRLRDRDKFEHWAMTIVANTAINMIRKNQIRTNAVTVIKTAARASNVVLEIEHKILRDQLIATLRQLDEQSRIVIIHKLYYGMKDREIADLMSLPLGTVKAKVHRAKEKLRTLLSDDFS